MVLYGRKSTADAKRPGKSVDDQLAVLRDLAEREDWTVLAELHDGREKGAGASRHSRTVGRDGFAAVLAMIRAQTATAVAVVELSRATRDLTVYADLVNVCAAHGVALNVAGRWYDPDDAQDRLALGISAVVDEAESDRVRTRVRRGMRLAADAGRPHGKLLYGYSREYDPASGRLLAQVEHPEQAAVVREAARRVVAGETPYAIAQDFNARGIPTPRGGPRGWDLTQVKRLVTRPAYVAQRVYGGRVVGKGEWPAILEERTYAACVARLSDPTRRTQRDSAVRHLLSGIAVCGVCGDRVRVQRNRGSLAYLCASGGFHVSRTERLVDDVVTVAAVDRLARPDLVELLAGGEDTAVREALAEAKELRDRLSGFYDSAAAPGGITPAALARIEAQMLPQIEAAEQRARRVVVAPVLVEAAGPDADARWDRLTLPQRRDVIRALMDVRILPAGRGRRTFDPRLIEITWRTA